MKVQEYKGYQKGSITVFLSLIIVIISSFIIAIFDCAVIKTYGNIKSVDAKRAAFSLFGEYQDELFNDYSILSVDSRYGKDEAKEKYIEDKMRLFGTNDMDHKIEGIQLLTDENCAAFREQAIRYIEGSIYRGQVAGFVDETAWWDELVEKGDKASKKDEEYKDMLSSLKGSFDSSDTGNDNVFELLEDARNTSLLDKLVPDGIEISSRKYDLSNFSSHRQLRKGRGLSFDTSSLYLPISSLSFNEYVLKKYNSMTDTRLDCPGFMYEVEYIISGKNSDKANLEKVAKKLIFIRLVSNYAYLKSSVSKIAEIKALALSIATVMFNPELEDPISELLTWLWAYTESKCDVAALFNNLKVPKVKSDSTWQSGLFDCFSQNITYSLSDSESGLSYEDYLRILLYTTNKKDVTKRAVDLAELNISSVRSKFKIDNCFVKIKLYNTAYLLRGFTYKFPLIYGYN